jgi:ABC-2 type transport system permease protein
MNRALWIKAISDAWRQLVVSMVLLSLFSWLFVWLMSRFPVGGFGIILKILPGFVQTMVGVPLDMMATPVGQLSILYVHVVTLLVCVGWALGRGSDSIAGEISRGTMDLILTLPIWRVSVVVIPAIVTAAGSAMLSASIVLGTWLGLSCVHFDSPVALAAFLPGAVNLACMTFCFTGVTTMISAGIRDRWMAFAFAGGFYVAELVIVLISRMWTEGKWLVYLTFLSAFEPQMLILGVEKSRHAALRFDLTLIGLGLACYIVAVVIFNRRDIPGPR